MDGFSIDFAMLNPCGFLFYSLYSTAGYIDYNIGAGKVSYPMITLQVQTNDLFFALHAFALSAAQLSHIFVYEVRMMPINDVILERQSSAEEVNSSVVAAVLDRFRVDLSTHCVFRRNLRRGSEHECKYIQNGRLLQGYHFFLQIYAPSKNQTFLSFY